MRISGLLSTFALVLVPAALSAQTPATPTPAAQTPAAQPAASTSSEAWTGSVDFGARGTTSTGDVARYERYRDLGDGLFVEDARAKKEQGDWLFDLGAQHVARKDQRYTGEIVRPGKLKASGMWDQIPMLLSDTTQSIYTGLGTAVLTMDDGIQSQAQSIAASTQSQSAKDAATRSLFAPIATTFETSTKRKIGDGGFQYLANPALTFMAHARHTSKDGAIPYGGSFGHSSFVELPSPIHQDTSEVEAGAEYAQDPILLRAGYTGSWFHNDVSAVEFDNPFVGKDSTSASSRGRLSVAPSNSFIAVNGFASFKLAHKTRASAYFSTGLLQDAGAPLMPQTINTALSPAALPRTTVEGEARTNTVNLTFVSRPSSHVDFNVRYRRFDYDNRTPEFLMTQRVSYDNSVSAVNPPVETEPYGVIRGTFDADFRYIPAGGVSAGVGYSQYDEERTHRIYETTTDKVFRLLFDKVSSNWFTLRTKYEHAERRGTGIEEGEAELLSIGEQPGMRHFDIAPRDRDRVTFLGAVTPGSNVSFSGSVGVGKDDYLESEFGVRDNNNWVYGAGVDYTPTDRTIFSASYWYERYYTLSRSRQANPPTATDQTFYDPSRNWATKANDRAHTFIASAEIDKIADKINLRLAYDFSHARGTYDYTTGAVVDRTLPEEVIVPSTLPPPTALPPTLSQLERATMDATYPVSSRISFGVSWWYERYKVEDFTLDEEANQNLVRGQSVLMGYMYKPYTANTIWGRMIYAW